MNLVNMQIKLNWFGWCSGVVTWSLSNLRCIFLLLHSLKFIVTSVN